MLETAETVETPVLDVRKGSADDFDAVLDFYTQMIDQMRGTDFDVRWEHGTHPSPALMRNSLAVGQLYCGWLGDELASAMIVNHEGAQGYDAVPWQVQAEPEQVGVLHVVATLPKHHGRGFARQLMQGVIDAERAAGTKALRLDTFPFNVRGRGLYESFDFQYLGDHKVLYPELGVLDISMYELEL